MNSVIKTMGLVGLLGASVGVSASPINVGGVVWDPDAASDFLMQYNFTQWFTSSINAIDSTPNLAPNYDAATPIAPGNVLTGVGQVYSINGTPESTFCPSCELTVVFGGIQLTNTGWDFSNGFINFYADSTPDFPWPGDAVSQSDADAAADGLLWLSLGIDTFALTSGTVEGGQVSALGTVNGGAAANNFVSGTQLGYDVQYSGGAFFINDSLYSNGGNGQVFAETIPEPTSLALLGLGLLGFGAVRKKA